MLFDNVVLFVQVISSDVESSKVLRTSWVPGTRYSIYLPRQHVKEPMADVNALQKLQPLYVVLSITLIDNFDNGGPSTDL